MSIISVIIPVYNVEMYLEKCIESVLAQTIESIEIVLVDDGSTDNSGAICDSYAKKYENIQVIHKENGGLSSARNAGVQIVQGEYVGFVDSDDYVHPEMYQILLERIEKDCAEVAVCGVYDVYQTSLVPQCAREEEFVCDSEEMFRQILIGERISGTACNKLIRTEIAKRIMFPEGKLFEDAFYCGQLVQHISKATVTTKPYYYYVHRSGSITTSPFKSKDMDVIEAFALDAEIVKQNYPKLQKEAKFALDSAYLRVLDKMLLTPCYRQMKEYPLVLKYLKNNTTDIIHSDYFFRTRKIAIRAFRINVRLYRWFLIVNEKMNRKQI